MMQTQESMADHLRENPQHGRPGQLAEMEAADDVDFDTFLSEYFASH